MSKSRGLKIVLEFDRDLIGDITGNASAFTVTGLRPNPMPYGPLQMATFPVGSVARVSGVDNAIELVFTDANRFADVNGVVTVAYNASVGDLTGSLPVESFSESFTPEDLIGSPVHVHSVAASLHAVATTLTKISYEEVYNNPDYVTARFNGGSLVLAKV